MIDTIRRVVTGQTPRGQNVFTHVEEVEAIEMGDTRWYGVWGWDEPPRLPYYEPAPYAPRSAFPDPMGSGLRLNVITFPPGAGVIERTGSAQTDTAASDEWRRLAEAQDYGRKTDVATGMHRTDSVDIGVVLSGEVNIAQDDDVEITLRPGDFYVQNGAWHAWRNRTTAPCTMAFIVISAARASDE